MLEYTSNPDNQDAMTLATLDMVTPEEPVYKIKKKRFGKVNIYIMYPCLHI